MMCNECQGKLICRPCYKVIKKEVVSQCPHCFVVNASFQEIDLLMLETIRQVRENYRDETAEGAEAEGAALEEDSQEVREDSGNFSKKSCSVSEDLDNQEDMLPY